MMINQSSVTKDSASSILVTTATREANPLIKDQLYSIINILKEKSK